jgi:parallel beta-helix repeat protein
MNQSQHSKDAFTTILLSSLLPFNLLFLLTPLHALIINVPADSTTIQGGINGAVDGDTVLVADGTYTGDGNRDIDFTGKAIVVTSENGPDVTILDCEGDSLDSHRGFYFHNGEGVNSVVRGFTVKNGCQYGDWGDDSSFGGGILCNNASPVIEDNIIVDNTANWFGGGIACRNNASPSIVANKIINNSTVYRDGGGIACRENSDPTISGNTITGNRADNGGGGIYLVYSTSAVTDNIISGNTASDGGGIYCYSSSALIARNEISGNESSYGGGIHLSYSGPTITDNTITGNDGYWGGGIYFGDAGGTAINNIITGNIARRGGGIFFHWASGTLINNFISRNTSFESVYGGGGIESGHSYPDITNNTITENEAGTSGAGVYCWGSYYPSINNSILWNNVPSEIDGPVTVTYSDVEGGWPGQGNVNADPQFVLPGNGDHRLMWESPCIDAGHPDSLDADGTRRDMGAFYFDQVDFITLYLTPDTTEVARGGQLGVTYTLINRWDQVESFWGQTQVILPNGYPYPVMGPGQMTLPANTTIQHHFDHNVPGMAPLGVYDYWTRIGTPPSMLYDEDSFTFSVIGSSR